MRALSYILAVVLELADMLAVGVLWGAYGAAICVFWAWAASSAVGTVR